jgi:hypothetical protein
MSTLILLGISGEMAEFVGVRNTRAILLVIAQLH